MFRNSSKRSRATNSGVALVLVLTMLVLLSALLIAFMSAASTETAAAKATAQQMEARQAADAAVNLVIGQIRDATTSPGDGASPDASKGSPRGFTWASQPGAIRTFGPSSSVYKLYSATKMREGETEFARSAPVDAAEGLVDPEEMGFADLNEPALVPVDSTANDDAKGFEPRYPIVNPYGQFTFDASSGKFNVGSRPSTAGTGAIEGFSCESVPDNNRKDANGNSIPMLPMWVKWIYILKDGSFAPVDANGKIIGATAANPPVARTAFWTDDETSKLNINTATEGTYWDTPSVGTYQESGNAAAALSPVVDANPDVSLNLAVSQPARNEFQRYPGHPATVSLSPAIRWLFPGYKYPMPTSDPDVDYKEMVYRMAPRVVGGGKGVNPDTGKTHNGTSMGGTFNTDNDLGTSETTVANVGPIPPDKERLFATVDEYFFRPDRTGRNQPVRVDAYNNKEVAISEFRPEHIDKLRFFLTAHSRSPELTMFGTPRVTTWPIYRADAFSDKRTAFDDTFAFCSTLGGQEYFFTRRDALHQESDFASSDDNQRLYRYLQHLTGKPLPWGSASFEDKYGQANRDQLLTQIYDYIRTVNLVDTSTTRTGQLYGAAFTPFYWPDRKKQNTMPEPYSGQVAPIRIKANGIETQGFGRFVTVAEAALLFYRATPSQNNGPFQMRCVLLLEMYTPAQGFPALRDTYSVRVRLGGIQDVDLDATPVAPEQLDWFEAGPSGGDPTQMVKLFPPDMFNIVTIDAYTSHIARVFMPFRGFANQLLFDTAWNGRNSFSPHSWNSADRKIFARLPFGQRSIPSADRIYPFYSDPVTIPGGAQKFDFKGGTFVIDIYATTNPGSNEKPVQTLRIKFASPQPGPSGGWPVPDATSTDFYTRLAGSLGYNGNRNQLDSTNANSGYKWIQPGDVIRSYEVGGPTYGDHRLVAALPRVNYAGSRGQGYYQPRGGSRANDPYFSSTRKHVHGLRASRGGFYPTGSYNSTYNTQDGRLVPGSFGSTYRTDRQPRVPQYGGNGAPIDGVRFLQRSGSLGGWGDWDRGLSKNVSGAFINKPDEGNFNFNYGSTSGTRLPYFLGFGGFEEAGPSFFTPNRIMPGPGMLGSLPTQLLDGKPWQTLLFRPPSEPPSAPHPGSADPKDHYILDMFHMPVVEPYAISEPFSTAGKVNINYQIAPFGYLRVAGRPYIERKTAMYGLLKAQKMLMVPNNAPSGGHRENPLDDRANKWRVDVDRFKTLQIMDNMFEQKGLFKTASEICDVPLVPANLPSPAPPVSLANPLNINWMSLWQGYLQTGDNQRERPYVHLYSRVTTRSNVYTVYVRAQSIRKHPKAEVDLFDPNMDQVAGEYRGQTTIERYIDPNDPNLKNYDPTSDSEGTGGSADRYYRFRVVNSKQFVGN